MAGEGLGPQRYVSIIYSVYSLLVTVLDQLGKGLVSRPGREEIILVASCYGNPGLKEIGHQKILAFKCKV